MMTIYFLEAFNPKSMDQSQNIWTVYSNKANAIALARKAAESKRWMTVRVSEAQDNSPCSAFNPVNVIFFKDNIIK